MASTGVTGVTVTLYDGTGTAIATTVTDNDGEVRFDPVNKPGVSNLLSILAAATDGDPEKLADGYSQYGPLKADVAAALIALIEPIQARLAELDDTTVRAELGVGAERAQAIAAPVMDRAKRACGLLV